MKNWRASMFVIETFNNLETQEDDFFLLNLLNLKRIQKRRAVGAFNI